MFTIIFKEGIFNESAALEGLWCAAPPFKRVACSLSIDTRPYIRWFEADVIGHLHTCQLCSLCVVSAILIYDSCYNGVAPSSGIRQSGM